MLRRIGLTNFKCWKELDIELAPITLLFGANSSGKSAILQSLLMLRYDTEFVNAAPEWIEVRRESDANYRWTSSDSDLKQARPTVSSPTRCYILPWEITSGPQGSIALLEQPELHLHPNAQAALADLMLHVIEFDRDGHAIVPAEVMIEDESDRKFIAVAIASEPYAPIYNAADTDWAKERDQLVEHGLTIHELCPGYIQHMMPVG